jgi:hypothetical protein
MNPMKTSRGFVFLGGAAWFEIRRVNAPALFVSPTTGIAPLTVNITTNPFKDPGGREYMDYGDGTRELAQGGFDPGQTHSFTHTYTKPGTYTVTFFADYIYDRQDPTYANNPEIFTQPSAQTDPFNPHGVVVPRPLGSQVVVVYSKE